MGKYRGTATIDARLLQWATLLLLVFRGYQYIIWDNPLRNLFWDESAFSGIAQWLGWAWTDWIASPRVNALTDDVGIAAGVILVAAGGAAMWAHRQRWWWTVLVATGGALCLLHVLFSGKTHFFHVGYYVEMTLQWATPFLLLLSVYERLPASTLHFLLRVAIALTFAGHGLYAVGYYPVPAAFTNMMMSGFGLDNATAISALRIAGWLDFVAAALLLVPYRVCWMPALYYAIGWGALTALARVWSHYTLYSTDTLLTYWLAESLVRWVHFLVPLALWLRVRRESSTS